MQQLWNLRRASIREIQESLPENRQVEYTTVQTIVYRLEKKGAVERTRKIGNAHLKWAFSEAIVLFMRECEQAKRFVERKAKKHNKQLRHQKIKKKL